jgi:hypothetical protein
MYSNIKLSALRTPFCTLSSGTRYSFMSAGSTVNGAHVSATMAIATVVQTRFWRSWTLRLFSRVTSTSCIEGWREGWWVRRARKGAQCEGLEDVRAVDGGPARTCGPMAFAM